MTLSKLPSRAVEQPNGCRLIGKPSPRKRYHSVFAGGRTMGAHRFVWEATHGAVPKGMEVCHSCDNPRCVNASHLFLGTHKENIMDALTKGRLHRNGKTLLPATPYVKKGHHMIKDEFTELNISRQRKYQLRMARNGKCTICGEPSVSSFYCLKHMVYQRERARELAGCKRRYNSASYKIQATIQQEAA